MPSHGEEDICGVPKANILLSDSFNLYPFYHHALSHMKMSTVPCSNIFFFSSLKIYLFYLSQLSNDLASYRILGWKEILLHWHFEPMDCLPVFSIAVVRCVDAFLIPF